MKASDFSAQLASLKSEFAASLPDRLAAIVTIWQNLDDKIQPQEQEQQLRLLHRTVHGITGAAGSLGMPELSSVCRPFEQFLKARINDQSPLSAPERQHGNTLLLNVHTQVAAAAKGKKEPL